MVCQLRLEWVRPVAAAAVAAAVEAVLAAFDYWHSLYSGSCTFVAFEIDSLDNSVAFHNSGTWRNLAVAAVAFACSVAHHYDNCRQLHNKDCSLRHLFVTGF